MAGRRLRLGVLVFWIVVIVLFVGFTAWLFVYPDNNGVGAAVALLRLI